jgi:hypothetical protein
MSEKQAPIVQSILESRRARALAEARMYQQQRDKFRAAGRIGEYEARRYNAQARDSIREAARWRRLQRASSQFTTRHASDIISAGRTDDIGWAEQRIFGVRYYP